MEAGGRFLIPWQFLGVCNVAIDALRYKPQKQGGKGECPYLPFKCHAPSNPGTVALAQCKAKANCESLN